MAQEKPQNLQDTFLNHVRKQKVPVTVFLVNGVKLQGIVTWFDNFCLLLRREVRASVAGYAGSCQHGKQNHGYERPAPSLHDMPIRCGPFRLTQARKVSAFKALDEYRVWSIDLGQRGRRSRVASKIDIGVSKSVQVRL